MSIDFKRDEDCAVSWQRHSHSFYAGKKASEVAKDKVEEINNQGDRGPNPELKESELIALSSRDIEC